MYPIFFGIGMRVSASRLYEKVYIRFLIRGHHRSCLQSLNEPLKIFTGLSKTLTVFPLTNGRPAIHNYQDHKLQRLYEAAFPHKSIGSALCIFRL